ncbi:nitrate- and nitrite sensing domain-containing protein [Uliginosibacterium sp. H3]|uniref:Nitrate- and nitrite sensing domain-containing protein n=1 Tax=Uliginosibacterium silvisoli TaxID=3114758 RepID=A0ABU6K945_9RHOO|nr:nitrate- and nitrite sensing domain-containing protein [Uliginosibacterium sp. H3]
MSAINAFAIVAMLLCGVACAYFYRIQRRGRDVGSVRKAIDGAENLLKLIKLIQQHRGASAAFLSGDASFRLKMDALQAAVQSLTPKLQELARAESTFLRPVFSVHDMGVLLHRWKELLERLDSSSVDQSITAHSQLISKVLEWLAGLGEARVEIPMGERLPVDLARNFAHRLPALAECLGQSRALGSAVTARGECNSVSRVRLMFLVARAKTLLDQAASQSKDPSAAVTVMAVEQFLATIRTGILEKNTVGMDAGSYFAQATSAIDAVFAWIDACKQRMTATLETEESLVVKTDRSP